jgi:hypothetical protein
MIETGKNIPCGVMQAWTVFLKEFGLCGVPWCF